MTKAESKYFNTAVKMDEAFLTLLGKKDFAYITVKEICALSGVNRSTFYLHYETLSDLLLETEEYVSRKFYSYFEHLNMDASVALSAPKEELMFIKPEFLAPWLSFIRDNKLIYSTAVKHFDMLNMGKTAGSVVCRLVDTVLERYGFAQRQRGYMIHFYLEGMNGIVKEWLRGDCRDSIEEVIEVIEACVRPQSR